VIIWDWFLVLGGLIRGLTFLHFNPILPLTIRKNIFLDRNGIFDENHKFFFNFFKFLSKFVRIFYKFFENFAFLTKVMNFSSIFYWIFFQLDFFQFFGKFCIYDENHEFFLLFFLFGFFQISFEICLNFFSNCWKF